MMRVLWLWLALSASGLGFAEESGFLVESAELVERNGEFILNADIAFDFSAEAIDALRHGVPLTINMALQTLRERKYFWDQTILDLTLRFKLHYHALVKLFQVVDLDSGLYRNFVTLESAIEDLGRIRGLAVMKTESLEKKQRYYARIKVRLGGDSLPLPLRVVSYLSPQWYLSSPWYTWPLEN